MGSMKIIVSPRGGGKTEALLRWMQEAPEGEHRVFVAFSSQEAMRVLRLAREQDRGLDSWQFVGVEEARDPGAWSAVTRFRGGRIVLGFDNLDMWLERQFSHEVAVVTMTEP